MDELTLFAEQEKTMTTRELAETLGVSIDTVTRAASKVLDPSAILRRVVNGGESRVFTERQATIIKQEIQKHHNLATRQIDNVSTELEENQTIANAIMILQRRSEELKQRAEVAEKALDRIACAPGCFTMSQTAKALKLPYGRTTLFGRLRDMGLLNCHNEPYQEQINAARFRVVSKLCGDGKNHLVPLVTGKGLVFLAKKFNAEIDESVKADA